MSDERVTYSTPDDVLEGYVGRALLAADRCTPEELQLARLASSELNRRLCLLRESADIASLRLSVRLSGD